MSSELMVADRSWLAIKNSGNAFPAPFRQSIELGEYDLRGLVHLDNPSVKFAFMRCGTVMDLKIDGDSCEVLYKGEAFGWLPASEGRVFVRLMMGGKRLVANVVSCSTTGLEPEMRVSVKMEDM